MRRCNFKRFFPLGVLLFFAAVRLHAQNVTMVSRDIDTLNKKPAVGPNRAFYAQELFQLGAIVGPQEYGYPANPWSASFSYGFRMKAKLCSWNAFTFDFGYHLDRFSMNQKQVKLPPFDPARHKRQTLSANSLYFSFCDRVNIGRRGDVLGRWIDFGGYGEWIFRATDFYVDQHYDSNSPSGYNFKTKTRIARLPYIDKFDYGFTVRFGGEMFALFADYRMSDLIKASATPNGHDLPRLAIGIDLAVGQ